MALDAVTRVGDVLPATRGRRVLIAEDSVATRKALVMTLRTLGAIEIAEAGDGAEAIRRIEERAPDLLLCDLEMPVLNGLQTLNLLRARWSAADLPVLMLTAHASIDDKVAAFRAGANDYVAKPAHPAELLARVTAQLDLKTTIAENLRSRGRLMQANRLEAVGRLAAGIAHEINTPAQYVSDNLQFIDRALTSFRDGFDQILALLEADAAPEAVERAREMLRRKRIDYLSRETPLAISQSREGIERIARLVADLDQFTDPGDECCGVAADLNRAVENILAVSQAEWRDLVTISLDLDPDLPRVPCRLPELKHALLSIVHNAIEALRGDFGHPPRHGQISIASRLVDGGAEVVIGDDGPGINEEIRSRVFDPFFTTKEVGKGSGQGLAIGYDVIVNKHGGRLSCERSEWGGACFRAWLPSAESARASRRSD